MLRILNFILLPLFFAVSSPANADAGEVELFPDHLLSLIETTELTLEIFHGVEIYFDETRPSSIDSRDRLIEIIPEIYRSLDIENPTECNSTELRIFLLRDDILLDRDIMSFLSWEAWDNRDVWGVYWKSSSTEYREMFVSSEASGDFFNHIVVHEFYHRYQDLMCKSLRGESIEADAKRFTRVFCRESDIC